MHSTNTSHRNPHAPHAVDNTDWLKTVAIILGIDRPFRLFLHQKTDSWWSVFPDAWRLRTFFFLLGYAHADQDRPATLDLARRHLDLARESWNAKWTWVAPNILLSLALIRSARPYAQILLQRHGWAAFAFLRIRAFGRVADSGQRTCRLRLGGVAGGQLFPGLCQRMYVDSRSVSDVDGPAQSSALPAPAMKENAGQMRLLACLVAVVAYVWQEQTEYLFSSTPSSPSSFSASAFRVREPMSLLARPEPHSTPKNHCGRPALHRPAHFGNLRNPACRLRTPCEVGAGSRTLTRDWHFLLCWTEGSMSPPAVHCLLQ